MGRFMTVMYGKMLELLRQTDNNAADQALGYALLAESGERLDQLVSALLHRGTDEALAYVIQVYHKLDPALRQNLVDRCPGISGALRMLCKHPDPTVRNNVIELIAASNQPKLSYVLALLFYDDLPGLRKNAAETFKKIAFSLRHRLQVESQNNTPANGWSIPTISLADDLNQFFLALDVLLGQFPSHLRTEVVEAGMIFAPWLSENLWNKFTGERNRIGRIATEILTRESNLNYAGFAFRALTCPELGRDIARLAGSECNTDYMRQWISYGRYRLDPNVRKNLPRIKEFRWLAGNLKPLLETPPDLQIKFIDILMLTSVPPREKLDILAALMITHDPLVQEHVVATLIDSKLPEITKLLQRAVVFHKTIPFSAKAAGMAAQYLQHVSGETEGEKGLETPAEPINFKLDDEQYFEQFWLNFERLDPPTCLDAIERLQRLDNHFDKHFSEKLDSKDADERNRALTLIRRGRLVEKFSETIYRLCDDPDVLVRSSAVSALASLPGEKSEQKLIEALDDENLRVQANAIEVLEIFNPPDLPDLIESKLASPNNRIRANAIKAILKPQYVLAVRALSTMLDHPDPSFRRSALWAVSQTTPLHLVKKVYDLARHDNDPEVKLAAKQAIGDLLECWKSTGIRQKDISSVGAEK